MSGIWRPSYFHSGYHCCPKRMKEEEKTAKQPKRRRKEDDMTIMPFDQRRVETPENCPLVSRTSFAARSRRTLRRIFPDGLKRGGRKIRLQFAKKYNGVYCRPFRNFWDDNYATTQVLGLSYTRLDPFLDLFCDKTLSSDVVCRLSQNNVCSGKLSFVDFHADNTGICDVWVRDQEAFQFCRWYLESLENQT